MKYTGPYEGIAPTGRTIAVDMIMVVRVKDGKIAEERLQMDGQHDAAAYGTAGRGGGVFTVQGGQRARYPVAASQASAGRYAASPTTVCETLGRFAAVWLDSGQNALRDRPRPGRCRSPASSARSSARPGSR